MTKRAVGNNIRNIFENMKTNFLAGRIFFSPSELKNYEEEYNAREQIRFKCEVQGLTQSYHGTACLTSMADLQSCNVWVCPWTSG